MDNDLEVGDGAGPAGLPINDKKTVTNNLSFRNVDAVEVLVQNLSVDVDLSPRDLLARGRRGKGAKEFKRILNDISAFMSSGSLTAILGGSGSGKTSFLNTLSHKISESGMKTTGVVSYNGSVKLSSIRSAYVMQQDILLPMLTVRETLFYAADLRLPPPTTVEERTRIVEDVILELGLKECANTRIGNDVHKGCSGGEKRRTSLGVQMLANPSVLFLDEVTTGLDATSAYQLVRTLKSLAGKGRTVVVTIHQPRSEIWGLFDHVLLLSGGSLLYGGPIERCLPYFEGLGYRLPLFVNPAEYLIDLAAVDTRSADLEASSSARVEGLKQAWRSYDKSEYPQYVVQKFSGSNSLAFSTSKIARSALGRQIRVLTARTLKVTLRDPLGVTGSLLEAMIMGVLMGWIFLSLDGSLAGIRSKEGGVYTAASLQSYIILIYETYRMTLDIQLFDRENSEGVVSVPAFLISRRLARAPIEDVPVPLIFSVIFYFMAGFRHIAGQFFTFFAVTLLCQYISVTLATVCVAVSRHFAGASLIANMAYTIQSLGCGYFVQTNQIPVYMRWLKWTAYLFYAFGALAANEFVGHTSDPTGQFYDCPLPGGASNPACKEYTGRYIMESLGFPSNWIVRPIIILLSFVVAFFFGSGLILQYWKVGISMSKAQKTETDRAAGKESMNARSIGEMQAAILDIENYSLDIVKRNAVWWQNSSRISILKPITTKFEPGVLNVIMGPSGSGKTTLLDSVARRLYDSILTKYQKNGQILINGAAPSDRVIRSICGYVSQDDDSLLPYLTVRENLHFAASLRLPKYLTRSEKTQRAESILLKMGLRECADNLVGSELVKGISGGEKRRVTIAIQILTEPRVLLLDEPTSGLDAFTATSIIDVLRGLSEEGRTLVLTIHQSRSDLFKHFGNVVLLAHGGSPVYAGKGSLMLSHFASLGYDCPAATNPADFALDLISVDLQDLAREAASREKVRSLISNWNDTQPPLTQQTSQIATSAELGSLTRAMAPFYTAFPLLLHRSFINFCRNPPSVIARTTQSLGFSVVLTLFFAPLKSDYYSVQSRLGFILEFASLYFVGMLQNVAVYPDERRVFYSEYADNAYSVEAFFMQYTVAELPFEIFTALLSSVLIVFAAGLPRTASIYFIVTFNLFAVVCCGESLGIVFNTLVPHTGFAVSLISIVLSIAMVMAGIMSLRIPSFLQAWNHLSPIKWSIANLASYTLRPVTFSCTEAQRLPSGACPIETGSQVLALYGLDGNERLALLGLALCVILYRVLAYAVLKINRARWDGVGKGVKMARKKGAGNGS